MLVPTTLATLLPKREAPEPKAGPQSEARATGRTGSPAPEPAAGPDRGKAA